MRFNQVQPHLENGAFIARLRWNKDVPEGKKEDISFLFMTPSNKIDTPQALLDSGHFENKELTFLQFPTKKNRGERVSIYSPTTEDMFARDWYIVDFDKEWSLVCGHFRNRNNNNANNENRSEQKSDNASE